jgi:hypothetical protein
VTVLQAELRAIASRLVMPEFMLSSDASNANYSSTMVAEGPATRMFERMQHEMIEDDLAVMRHVVSAAAAAGRLPARALAGVQIRAVPPPLAVRNRLQEAQADQILVRSGAMSVQTMAMRSGLDPDHEQQLIAGRPGVQEHNFNPSQPRDRRGQWTSTGTTDSCSFDESPDDEDPPRGYGSPGDYDPPCDYESPDDDGVPTGNEAGHAAVWGPIAPPIEPLPGEPPQRVVGLPAGRAARHRAERGGDRLAMRDAPPAGDTGSDAPRGGGGSEPVAPPPPSRADPKQPYNKPYDPKTDTHNKDVLDRAHLADAAYSHTEKEARAQTPKGWNLVGFHSVGDVRAALFRSDAGKYVLAFRGTRITSARDATTNFLQAAGGVPLEYKDAEELAKVISWELDAKGAAKFGDLEVVGHSMGGGMATAAAIANGLTATVFNPAGLHQNTIDAALNERATTYYNRHDRQYPTPQQTAQWQQEMPQKIHAFAANYDVLTNLQDSGLSGLVLPHTYGTVHNVRVGDAYDKLVDSLTIGGAKILNGPVVRIAPALTVGVGHHLMKAMLRALGEEPNAPQGR